MWLPSPSLPRHSKEIGVVKEAGGGGDDGGAVYVCVFPFCSPRIQTGKSLLQFYPTLYWFSDVN